MSEQRAKSNGSVDLNLKHARGAAIHALDVMNDVEFYVACMGPRDLRSRIALAQKYLAEASSLLRNFETSHEAQTDNRSAT